MRKQDNVIPISVRRGLEAIEAIDDAIDAVEQAEIPPESIYTNPYRVHLELALDAMRTASTSLQWAARYAKTPEHTEGALTSALSVSAMAGSIGVALSEKGN